MPLQLVITDAGLAALVDAQDGVTAAIEVTQVGLSDAPFDAAPTLEELPGEFKRLDAIHGLSAAPNVISMTAQDASTDVYDVFGLALYLADGTLFASYGQDTAIFRKVSVASFLLAEDIAFSANVDGDILFGDASFTYPPATEEVLGVAKLATGADVADGVGADTIVTPEALAAAYVALASLGIANGVATLDADGKLTVAQRPPIDLVDVFTAASEAEQLALAAGPGDFCVRTDTEEVYILSADPATDLGNWIELTLPAPVNSVNTKVGNVVLVPADIGAVPTARAVTGTGLATGGGDLSADRAINVPAASQAEVNAHAIATKAVTPASLAGLFALLNGLVADTRRINAGGLATGGGTLSADRTISVTAASAADVRTGTATDRAITPGALGPMIKSLGSSGYCTVPTADPANTLLIQWGQFTAAANASTSVFFPMAFSAAAYSVVADGAPSAAASDHSMSDNFPSVQRDTITATSFQVANSADSSVPCTFIAIGKVNLG